MTKEEKNRIDLENMLFNFLQQEKFKHFPKDQLAFIGNVYLQGCADALQYVAEGK